MHFLAILQATPDILKQLLGELPPWVNYPEYERVTWLNTILAKLWPSVNEAVSNIVAAKADPILEKLSDSLKKFFITKVKLTTFNLGRPPKIAGIKVWCPPRLCDRAEPLRPRPPASICAVPSAKLLPQGPRLPPPVPARPPLHALRSLPRAMRSPPPRRAASARAPRSASQPVPCP